MGSFCPTNGSKKKTGSSGILNHLLVLLGRGGWGWNAPLFPCEKLDCWYSPQMTGERNHHESEKSDDDDDDQGDDNNNNNNNTSINWTSGSFKYLPRQTPVAFYDSCTPPVFWPRAPRSKHREPPDTLPFNHLIHQQFSRLKGVGRGRRKHALDPGMLGFETAEIV